jgi:hypothetical protein
VIGGHDEQACVGIALGDLEGSCSCGGSRVPPHRLDQDRRAGPAQRTQLLGHDEAVIVPDDRHEWCEARRICDPQRRLLHQSRLAMNRQELLGESLPGQRPEACARASGQEHRNGHLLPAHRCPLAVELRRSRSISSDRRRLANAAEFPFSVATHPALFKRLRSEWHRPNNCHHQVFGPAVQRGALTCSIFAAGGSLRGGVCRRDL